MSYNRNRRSDPLNNYFTNLIAFNLTAHKLLEAKDEDSFEIWFDKLRLIDPRSLFVFVKKNQDKLPKEHLEAAKWHFEKWGMIW